ncbi:MAG: lipoprotein N-acyltransferase Lnb domain-containing protein [Helicobacteraceae bacterium]
MELVLVGSGSGAGLFGHSFLKVGQEAIDFTTPNAKNESAWLLGALGGANKARLRVAPYKTREYAYTHKEARNLYIIDLNLSSEQEARLVTTARARAKTPKPYGFFRANCAGEILDLLASAGVKTRQNYLYTAPLDLVRALNLEQNAAQKIQAKKNVFYEQRARLSASDKHCVDLALSGQDACLDTAPRESTKAALAFLDAAGGDLALKVRLVKRAITFSDENKSARLDELRVFRRLGVSAGAGGANAGVGWDAGVLFTPYYSEQKEQNSLQKIELFSLHLRRKGFARLEVFRVLKENGFDLYFKDTSGEFALGVARAGGKFCPYLDLSGGLVFKPFAAQPFLWLGGVAGDGGGRRLGALLYVKAGVQTSLWRLDLKAFRKEYLPRGFGALGSSADLSANILHAKLEVIPRLFFELDLTSRHHRAHHAHHAHGCSGDPYRANDDLNLAINLLF